MNPNYTAAYAALIKALTLSGQSDKTKELIPLYLNSLKK